MADAVWYTGKGGEQKGPFSEDDVKGMLALGEIGPQDLVWKEGMAEWTAVAAVESFAEAAKAAPPTLPPQPVAAPAPAEAAVVNFLRSSWDDLRGILLDPDQGLDAAADRKSLPFNLIWIGLGVFLFALLSLQAAAKLPFIDVGTLIKTFFKAIVEGIVLYGLWFGATILALVPILKTPATWKDALSILGLGSIPMVALGLVIFVLAWATSYFYALFAAALPMQALFVYQVFLHTSKASRRVALYAVPAIYLATIVVYGMLRLAMS